MAALDWSEVPLRSEFAAAVFRFAFMLTFVGAVAADPPRLPLEPELAEALRSSEGLAVYRLMHPIEETEPELERMHDYPVIDRREVTGAAAAGLRDALLRPETWGASSAECFMPHHAVVVKAGGKTWDLIICFLCSNVHVWAGGEEPVELVLGDWAPLERALEAALGRTRVDPSRAGELVREPGHTLDLPCLEDLAPEVARILAGYGGRTLRVGTDTPLTPRVAAELAKFRGTELVWTRQGQCPPEAGAALARFEGCLNLTALGSLTPEMAEALAGFRGRLLEIPRFAVADPRTVIALSRVRQVSRAEVVGGALPAALEAAPPAWHREVLTAVRTRTINSQADPEFLASLLPEMGICDVVLFGSPAASAADAREGATVESVLAGLPAGTPWRIAFGCLVIGDDADSLPLDVPASLPDLWSDESAVWRALEGSVTPLTLEGGSIVDLVGRLGSKIPIRIRIADNALERAGETRITFNLRKPHSLERILGLALHETRLTWRVRNGEVVIRDARQGDGEDGE